MSAPAPRRFDALDVDLSTVLAQLRDIELAHGRQAEQRHMLLDLDADSLPMPGATCVCCPPRKAVAS